MHSPERLRSLPHLRSLVRETFLRVEDLVLPIFLNSAKKGKKEIASMPGVTQWSVDESLKFVESQLKNGIRSLILFGIPATNDKSPDGEAAWAPGGPVIRALKRYRKEFGDDLVLMADTCFCEYTDHGHCGTFEENSRRHFVRNARKTRESLARATLAYADAGADVIAPSGMLDGMVGVLREALDLKDYDRTAICSYAVKYASAFYGPFRDAAENAPKAGSDRRSYQMDPANRIEALREAELDLNEGADMLLVKPAGSYLDIVRDVANMSTVPVGAYQVSGEYAMIKAAGKNGWVNEDAVFAESLISIKRAGARFILSYWAPRAAELLKQGKI